MSIHELLASFFDKNNVTLLGYYLDGWVDLIEDRGDLVKNVRDHVFQSLENRQMPEIGIKEILANTGALGDENRAYTITQTSPGATTTIYIAKHGKDLYASWRSFIRPTINWKLVGLYALVALVLSVIVMFWGLLKQTIDVTHLITESTSWELLNQSLGKWLLYALLIFICELAILIVLGRIIKQNESAFLKSNIIGFTVIIATILSLFVGEVSQSMSQSMEEIISIYRANMFPFSFTIVGMITMAFNIFLGFLFLAVLAGMFMKRNLWAFILYEPNLFDAEDITAMNLSVHKSLLRALDSAGIDMSKLRLKQEFKGGRRGEAI
jgi:hypothetical protein